MGAVNSSRLKKFAAAKEAFHEWAARVREFLDSAHELTGEDAERADKAYRPYAPALKSRPGTSHCWRPQPKAHRCLRSALLVVSPSRGGDLGIVKLSEPPKVLHKAARFGAQKFRVPFTCLRFAHAAFLAMYEYCQINNLSDINVGLRFESRPLRHS